MFDGQQRTLETQGGRHSAAYQVCDPKIPSFPFKANDDQVWEGLDTGNQKEKEESTRDSLVIPFDMP